MTQCCKQLLSSSVIQLSSAPFIRKFYYKASDINYVALKVSMSI